jgi:dTMP kinase
VYESPQGHRCFIVALEGPDRLGKSTQASLLEASLEGRGISSIVEKAPFKDEATHGRIYDMLRTGEALRYPVVFQTLMGANRHLFQNRYLPNLAWHNDVVVLDRWNVSTLVYGAESGVPEETTRCILKGLVEPDLVLIFDGEPFSSPDEDDAYEADKAFQSRIRQRYVEWGNSNSNAMFIKANRRQEMIQREIVEAIQVRLKQAR